LRAIVRAIAKVGNPRRRSIDDAFVETFTLTDVAPIRSKMPMNPADETANLLAGLRIDGLQAVRDGGPYASSDEMFRAFYANQVAFNSDRTRDHIRMRGRITETDQAGAAALVVLDIKYNDLPLTVYSLDTWNASLASLDPARAVILLNDGTLNGKFHVEMLIPAPGARLHFWQAALSGNIRALSFVGHGQGWLTDLSGARTGRALVDIETAPVQGQSDSIRLRPIGGAIN
jgi:hypothetical protein